jgi:hypothetical protein
MTDLNSIQGIGKGSCKLLEAAGLLDAAALAKANADELCRELTQANNVLKIVKSTPTLKIIERWIADARKQIGMEDAPVPVADTPVDYEALPQIVELLAMAPLAIPLPVRQLVENQLAVADIPPAILLNCYSGDLQIRVTDRDATQRAVPLAPMRLGARTATVSHYVHLAEPAQQRIEIDTSRMRSIADLEKVGPRVPLPKNPSNPDAVPENDRVALIRAPLEKTNSGRSPRSRFYVRGVLHTHPLSMAFGAVITLLMAVLLPVSVVISVLLLTASLVPDSLPWVSPWFLVLPCCIPVLGLFYLIYGVGGKCRICNQRVFMPRACLKNTKAHYFHGLGYIIPMSLHMLVFRWFRCTYCGTPVRLKK